MSKTDKSITWADHHEHEGDVIPNQAIVTFQIGDSRIDVRLRDNRLIITGDDSLIIMPRTAKNIAVILRGYA